MADEIAARIPVGGPGLWAAGIRMNRLRAATVMLALTAIPLLAPDNAHAAPPDHPDAGVEGPSLPPTSPPPPPPSIDPEPSSGIEFAVPPPQASTSTSTRRRPADERSDPGNAPPSGAGPLVSGAYALPMAALAGGYMLWATRKSGRDHADIQADLVAIGIAVGGLGIYGGITLGVGAYRSYKLHRWARAHRVVALPQGSGLLTGGTLALISPLALVPMGVQLYTTSPAMVTTLVATSIVAALTSPIMFVIGSRRARHYSQTGGWRRPGRQFTAVPTLAPTDGGGQPGVALGVAGRF